MIGWWFQFAAKLQEKNRETEAAKDDRYTDEEVRRSAVYTREDLSLVVGLLTSLNQQVFTVKVILAVIAVIGVVIAFRV